MLLWFVALFLVGTQAIAWAKTGVWTSHTVLDVWLQLGLGFDWLESLVEDWAGIAKIVVWFFEWRVGSALFALGIVELFTVDRIYFQTADWFDRRKADRAREQVKQQREQLGYVEDEGGGSDESWADDDDEDEDRS